MCVHACVKLFAIAGECTASVKKNGWFSSHKRLAVSRASLTHDPSFILPLALAVFFICLTNTMAASNLALLLELLLLVSVIAVAQAFVAAPPSSRAAVVVAQHRPLRAESDNSSSSASSSGRQAQYGDTLDFPDSYVRCGRCQTIYAVAEDDLGRGRGRRLECSVCHHSWFQSKDRLMTLKKDDYELLPLPQRDLDRIQKNIAEGKSPRFLGSKKLYVGNIAFECHEDDFYEIFGKCGDVGSVSLIRDEEGKNRGFGFITMRTDEDGDRAMAELDGMSIRGRNIAVRESNN